MSDDKPTREPRSVAPYETLAAFALALVALAVLRAAPLETPYWWDAGAVYAPGAKWLNDHGMHLAVPGRFPSDLGRGHTPGFYLLTAVAYRLFGASPRTGHALVLLFSAWALAGTYALGARLFSRRVGVASALLLACAPLYLTMSSELLPEIPITALAVASLDAFARNALTRCALFATALVLFKETGVAVPAAIACALLYEGHREGSLRRGLKHAVHACAPPAVALAGFFLWQKRAEGWFVLPYHAALFEEGHSLLTQGWWVFRTMTLDDGRAPVFLAATALMATRALRRAPLFEEAPTSMRARRPAVLVAFALTLLFNQLFFTKMFFLERYALPAHPGLAIACAAALLEAPARRPALARIGAALVAVSCLWGIALRRAPGTYTSGEITFRYLDAIEAQRAVFRTLDTLHTPPVLLAPWPLTDALREPWLGYARRPYRVVSQYWFEDASADHSGDPPIERIVTMHGLGGHAGLVREARRRGYTLLERAQRGGAVVELWGLAPGRTEQ